MTWLFSQALMRDFENSHCSQEPAAESSPGTCSATEPYAQLNVMPTPQPFWRNDKTMDCSRFSRFGLTCAALTADRGEELLTAYLAGFRARTSAPQDQAQDSTANAPAFGANSSVSFAKLSPDGSEWKTVQCSLLEDSPQSLLTLPRWGSMRSGTLFQRATLAPGMSVTGFGSLLPTLTVCGNYNAKGASPTSGDGLATALKKLPTLVADDTGMRKAKYAQGGTPLSLAVQRLPTLLASDSIKPRRGAGSIASGGGRKLTDALDQDSQLGPLNPDWCEWFMGFPIGWTASDALETPKFQEWQQQHSPHLPPSLSEAA